MNEDIVRAAEQEMRRKAPDPLDGSRAAKKPKTEGQGGEEAGEETGVHRFDYHGVEALKQGAAGFLITCGYRREKSATKEACEVLSKYIPTRKFFPIKLACEGLVMLRLMPEATTAEAGNADSGKDTRHLPSSKAAADDVNVVEVFEQILKDVQAGTQAAPKWCQRMTPILGSCEASISNLQPTIEKIISAHPSFIPSGPESMQFAVMYKGRQVGGEATPNLDKTEALKVIANAVVDTVSNMDQPTDTDKPKRPAPKVNLKQPQVVYVAEILPITANLHLEEANTKAVVICAQSLLPSSLVQCKPKLAIRSFLSKA